MLAPKANKNFLVCLLISPLAKNSCPATSPMITKKNQG